MFNFEIWWYKTRVCFSCTRSSHASIRGGLIQTWRLFDDLMSFIILGICSSRCWGQDTRRCKHFYPSFSLVLSFTRCFFYIFEVNNIFILVHYIHTLTVSNPRFNFWFPHAAYYVSVFSGGIVMTTKKKRLSYVIWSSHYHNPLQEHQSLCISLSFKSLRGCKVYYLNVTLLKHFNNTVIINTLLIQYHFHCFAASCECSFANDEALGFCWNDHASTVCNFCIQVSVW